MKKFIFLLLVLLIETCFSIKWVRKERAYRYPENWKGKLLIDDGPSNIIHKFHDAYEPISFNCSVTDFKYKSKITFELKGKNAKNNEVNNVEFSQETKTINSIPGILTYNVRIKVSDTADFTSRWWCIARDSFTKSRLQTNYLEIRDISYWDKHYITVPTSPGFKSISTLDTNKMPIEFDCPVPNISVPEWTKYEINQVVWRVCEAEVATAPASCIDKDTSITNIKYLLYEQQNRNLILTGYRKDKYNQLPLFFACVYRNKPLFLYGLKKEGVFGGFLIEGVKLTGGSNTEIVVPKKQKSFEVCEVLPLVPGGTSKYVQQKFYPIVRGYNYNVVFYFKGKQLKDYDNYMLTSKYFQFKDSISSKYAGIYKAVVTDDTTKKTHETSFEIIVKSPPKLLSSYPKVLSYIEEDTTVNLTLKFANVDQCVIKINEKPMMNEKDPQDSGAVYTVSSDPQCTSVNLLFSKMTFKDNLNVQINLVNKIATLNVQFSYFIVPKIKFETQLVGTNKVEMSPKNSNCTTGCSSDKPHKFYCKIETSVFESLQFKYDIYWVYMNGEREIRIENGTDFNVDKEMTTLKLLPSANDTTKKLLTNNNLICVVNLTRGTYNSVTSKDCKEENVKEFCAPIQLDYYNMATAMVYWIILAILVFVILIILILLLVRYLRTNKGETYELDQLERQHGYDREKEVQDEMFKPYEREDYDPEQDKMLDHSGRLSLNDQSIGNSDDGELDNYDIDASHFDENGSITGQYGANPRSRTGV